MSWLDWGWKSAAALGAGLIGGAFALNEAWTPDDQIVSKSGAPDPNTDIGVTDYARFLCESTGATCTCSDIKDWLYTYWFGLKGTQVGLEGLQGDALKLAGKAPPSDLTARKTILEVMALVREFESDYEPLAEYDCEDLTDDWILGQGGHVYIKGITRKIRRVQQLALSVVRQYNFYKQPGEIGVGSPIMRQLDPDVLDPGGDDGPDSGSIGLGLLAGGAIALALIMGQSKTKGPA